MAALLLVMPATLISATSSAPVQDDAGSGTDAGDAFASATHIAIPGRYDARLDPSAGDVHDHYRFFLQAGSQLVLDVWLAGKEFPPPVPNSVEEVITLLSPDGVPLRAAPLTSGYASLAFGPVPVDGHYVAHVKAELGPMGDYVLCARPCEGAQAAGMGVGRSYERTQVTVMLVPPTHGDLGNPFGPTVVDYVDATLRGIRAWEKAIDAFVADYPEYSYLQEITVDIQIWDGVSPLDDHHVVVGYVASGPVFRGLALTPGGPILLSLLAASPRAGQALDDYPEVNDLEIVTMHEFGHAFGLRHTETWTDEHGPDLMNSPATFVYGDGSPLGDGGERTKRACISSLNLYGLAHIYRWIPFGEYQNTPYGLVESPLPYQWYCV